MASFVDIENVSYTGKAATEIFTKDLYESNLHSYGIMYMPNVKAKTQLAFGEVGNLWQEYSCAFTPEGTVKLSEDFIEPTPIKINLEECFDKFWGTFLAEQTEISLKGGIPKTFSDFMFAELSKEMKKEYEEIFWNGDKAYSGAKTYLALADGIVKQLDGDAKTVDVVGTTLTTANILGEIGKVADAVIAMEDINIDNHKIFVNANDYRKLVSALGENANSPLTTQVWSNYTKQGDKVYAYGFEVVPTLIAKNQMIAANPKNLVLGYDAESNENYLKFVDMRETTLDNQFRIGALHNIAVGKIYAETIVLYK